MTHALPVAEQEEIYSKAILGFWVYLMIDCILFATLFTTYVVLHTHTFGGPASNDLFEMGSALSETIVLLFSSFACGLAMLAAHRKQRNMTLIWFAVAFVLGIVFLVIELREFASFVHQGHSWKQSAFLSSFFTLVGTHGAHITVGLLWMVALMPQVMVRGISVLTLRRLSCLSMFWHFLDVVWIFIFSIVYLMGVI